MNRSRFLRAGVIATIVVAALTTALQSYQSASTAIAAQATVCSVDTPSGILLLRPHASSGRFGAGLNLVDPVTGDEIGRIDAPTIDAAFSTGLPGKALAIAGDKLLLIDAVAKTATVIDLAADSAKDLAPNPIQFRGSAGIRFILLGSPSFDRTYLVDLEAGTAVSLSGLIPTQAPGAPVFIPFAAVTPGDAHVVVWDGQHVYVASTADPGDLARVDTGAFAFAPDFSPDGLEMIYSESDGPGSGSTLVLVRLDGGEAQTVRTSEFAMVTLWIPATRKIFVDERTEQGAAAGKTFTVDLDTGVEQALTPYSGSLTIVQLSPSGTHALLGVERMSGGDWQIADFTTGAVEKLPQLSGGRALPGLYGDSRWSLIVPLTEDDDPLSGPIYRGVDLDAGVVGRLLEQPNGLIFMQQPVLSADGSKSLVIGQTESRQTIWLLDAAALRATKLAESSKLSGQFSPDGCHVAVSTESAIDGVPSVTISIRSTESDTVISSLHGVDLLVWMPTS